MKIAGLIGVILVLLLAGSLSVLAQETLDATYEADDGSFAFDYPSAWTVDVSDEDGAVYAYSLDQTVIFYSPAALESYGLSDLTDPVEAAELLAGTLDDAEVAEVETLDLGGRTAGGFVYTEDDINGAFVFIVFDDGVLGLVNGVSEDELDLPTFLLMATSFEGKKSSAPASLSGLSGLTGSNNNSSKEVVSLDNYDAASYRDVIAELRDLDLIGSGGDLVFTEDYAWFEGQGSFYTPLARDKPFTNFVMSAELSYTPSPSTDFETCTLGMRVAWSGSSATAYVDVGYANEGYVFYLDWQRDADAVYDSVTGPEIDDPHIFTIIAIEDQLTVFIDGELLFDNVTIDDREGTWGVGLTGKAPGAKCEARDIWVYQVP